MSDTKREIYGKIAAWNASAATEAEQLRSTSGAVNTIRYVEAKAKVEAYTNVLSLLRENEFLK